MPGRTSRGYRYPTRGDLARIEEAVKPGLEDVDADVQALANDPRLTDQRVPLPESVTEEKLTDTFLSRLGVSDSRATRRGKCINLGEQTTSLGGYSLLPTPDIVRGLVLPTDGLILVSATVDIAMANLGETAPLPVLYLNSIPVLPANHGFPGHVLEPPTSYRTYWLGPMGFSTVALTSSATSEHFVHSGVATVVAPAGTYDLSMRFAVMDGIMRVKNRRLWALPLAF